jgi:NADH:ubiquinone oxidoreductase subunit F (NADH-binding)
VLIIAAHDTLRATQQLLSQSVVSVMYNMTDVTVNTATASTTTTECILGTKHQMQHAAYYAAFTTNSLMGTVANTTAADTIVSTNTTAVTSCMHSVCVHCVQCRRTMTHMPSI